MPKAITKKSSKSKRPAETPKPNVGFFGKLRANKTIAGIVVSSANIISFSIKKALNMTWIAVSFSAIFLTPLYKAIADNTPDEDEEGRTLGEML